MPLLDNDKTITSLLRSARTIAVVGLSDKPYRDSNVIARYLLDNGYTVYPVNPAFTSVLGLRSFPDLASIGTAIDIVDVFRRPAFVPAVVRDAISAGMQTVWFQLGVSHPDTTADALRHGLQVIEERCIMVEHRRLIL